MATTISNGHCLRDLHGTPVGICTLGRSLVTHNLANRVSGSVVPVSCASFIELAIGRSDRVT